MRGTKKGKRDMSAEMFGRMEIVPLDSEFLRNITSFYKGDLSKATVLDIGCGTGIWSLGLAGSVREIVGIDLSEGMVEYANRNKESIGADNATFITGDWNKLVPGEGLLSRRYDIIIMHMTPAVRSIEDLCKAMDICSGCCFYTTAVYRRSSVRDLLDEHCPDRVKQPRTFFYRIMDFIMDNGLTPYLSYDYAVYDFDYTVKSFIDTYERMYSELTREQMEDIVRPVAKKNKLVNRTEMKFITLSWDNSVWYSEKTKGAKD